MEVNKMMYYLKLGFILLIFCVVAAGILAYINGLTDPIIKDRKIQEEKDTRSKLIPGADFILKANADSSFDYYAAVDSITKAVKGYTFIAEGSGYSGKIKTMVGVDSTFAIIAIQVIDQSETPGLGAKCLEPEFADRYSQMTISDLFVDKDKAEEKNIKSITGATITTRAITNSIREQIMILKKAIEAEQPSTTAEEGN